MKKNTKVLIPSRSGWVFNQAEWNVLATRIGLNPLAVGVGIQLPLNLTPDMRGRSQSPRGRGGYSTRMLCSMRLSKSVLIPSRWG